WIRSILKEMGTERENVEKKVSIGTKMRQSIIQNTTTTSAEGMDITNVFIDATDDIMMIVFFFQAEDGIRVRNVTGVQTCALPIWSRRSSSRASRSARRSIRPSPG